MKPLHALQTCWSVFTIRSSHVINPAGDTNRHEFKLTRQSKLRNVAGISDQRRRHCISTAAVGC